MEETNLIPEEQPVIKSTKTNKTVTPVLTELEQSIIARSAKMNIPALAAFFRVSESVIKDALAKAPKKNCNC